MKDRLENDIRELAGAEPAELARRLVHLGDVSCPDCLRALRGWTHPGQPHPGRSHPGRPHEFRTTCLVCGESGLLHVSLITRDEVVRVEASEPL